ncbi:SMP-30/gluconolactonase/LRE family protein [Ferrimonas sediminicola]|nr:SMP-30/gluconolactonase/LRE family protein [Ferrimonas sediminicola]
MKSLPSLILALLMGPTLVGCASQMVTQDVEEFVYPKAPDAPRFYWQKMLLGSQSVEHETEESRIQRFITGTTAESRGLSKPFGIAVHRGRIFVSDPPARDVLMFDPHQYRFKSLSADPNVTLMKPFGLEVADDGTLYVLDQTLKDIKVFNREGNWLRTLSLDAPLEMPTDLALSPDGRSVFVSETGKVDNQNHVIYRFDATSGELLDTLGSRGKGEMEFNFPKGIDIDEDNKLYVVDSGNFRVQVIDLEARTLVHTFGQVGRTFGSFSRPKDIAVDGEGRIYVTDAAFGNVQIFNQQGQLLMFIGERGGELRPGVFMLNSGIDVDEDGRILMADQFFRKVDIFRPVAVAEDQGFLGERLPISDDEYRALKQKLDSDD